MNIKIYEDNISVRPAHLVSTAIQRLYQLVLSNLSIVLLATIVHQTHHHLSSMHAHLVDTVINKVWKRKKTALHVTEVSTAQARALMSLGLVHQVGSFYLSNLSLIQRYTWYLVFRNTHKMYFSFTMT